MAEIIPNISVITIYMNKQSSSEKKDSVRLDLKAIIRTKYIYVWDKDTW